MSDKLLQSADELAGEPPDERTGTLLRSGTAARLADVPVTTLRVWERRYGVVAGVKSPNGQRLYSPHDVLRLKLLRQLTHSGHAIGTIATLELDALQAFASAEIGSAGLASGTGALGVSGALGSEAPRVLAPSRVVVVGAAAAHRVATLAGCVLLASHTDLAHAQRGAAAAFDAHGPVDVLLVQLASLQPAAVDAVLTLAVTLQADSTVLLYTFGGQTSVQTLRAAGVMVQREPVTSAALAQWLQAGRRGAPLAGDSADMTGAARPGGAGGFGLGGGAAGDRYAGNGAWSIDPPRFSDAELAELSEFGRHDAGPDIHARSTDGDAGDAVDSAAIHAIRAAQARATHDAMVHCECMRHIAEIVVQLAAFERYSADCASISVSDAALHRNLHALTAAARTRFEQALQRVVSIEGVTLSGRPGIEAQS